MEKQTPLEKYLAFEEAIKSAIKTSIECQEAEEREEYNLGQEDAYKYTLEMAMKHFGEKCIACNGYGYTAEHDPVDPHEGGQCSNCPIQVQCEKCRATGYLLSTPPPAIPTHREWNKILQIEFDKENLGNSSKVEFCYEAIKRAVAIYVQPSVVTDVQVETAADSYANEQNSAYTNDYYSFIAGAKWMRDTFAQGERETKSPEN